MNKGKVGGWAGASQAPMAMQRGSVHRLVDEAVDETTGTALCSGSWYGEMGEA